VPLQKSFRFGYAITFTPLACKSNFGSVNALALTHCRVPGNFALTASLPAVTSITARSVTMCFTTLHAGVQPATKHFF